MGWNYWLPLYRFFTFWALAPHSSHSSFSSYTFQPLFRFLIFFYILSEVKRLLYTYNIQVVRLMNTIMDTEKKNKEESVWCVGKQRKEMKRFLHYSRECIYTRKEYPLPTLILLWSKRENVGEFIVFSNRLCTLCQLWAAELRQMGTHGALCSTSSLHT